MKRRHLLGCLAALPLAQALGRPGIVQRPLARVIVDNDFAGDPDGLVALAHQLLAPATTSEPTSTSYGGFHAMPAGLPLTRTSATSPTRPRSSFIGVPGVTPGGSVKVCV